MALPLPLYPAKVTALFSHRETPLPELHSRLPSHASVSSSRKNIRQAMQLLPHQGLQLPRNLQGKRSKAHSGIKLYMVKDGRACAHHFPIKEWCSLYRSEQTNWLILCREVALGLSSNGGDVCSMRSIFKCSCMSTENDEAVDQESYDKEVLDPQSRNTHTEFLEILTPYPRQSSQCVASVTETVTDFEEESPSVGVTIAIAALKFYKSEISPLLPGSCRYVPTCSEYGMQAFKKYGVVKGVILTAWRLSRCNPLGGSGFDPPRWFDEPRPPSY